MLPEGPRPSREPATEAAEEVKEKVCRLNQEVGLVWLFPAHPIEYCLGSERSMSCVELARVLCSVTLAK